MADTDVPKHRKYIPKPEGLNLELHLASVASEMLNVQRCVDCREFHHPPRWYCPGCHSPNYEFVPVSGRGRLYSMAINHFTIDRGWIDDLPYVTAIVELDEGPRVVGELRGVQPGGASLGAEVQLRIEPRGEEFAYIVVELI